MKKIVMSNSIQEIYKKDKNKWKAIDHLNESINVSPKRFRTFGENLQAVWLANKYGIIDTRLNPVFHQ